MTKFMPFVFEQDGYMTNQKCFIITGKCLEFLTAFLNSSVFKFCFRDAFPELQGGTRELSKIFFDKIPVPQPNPNANANFKKLITKTQKGIKFDEDTKVFEIEIDNMIFDLYELSQREKETIGFIEIR